MAAFLAVTLVSCSSGGTEDKQAKAASTAPRILHFYGSPGAIARGDTATVCYGVENTASLRLEPPIEELKPSYNRCFQVTPAETTEYKLTAQSASGERASISFTLTVGPRAAAPPPPANLILFFTASVTDVSAGRPVTLCYGVKGATRVSLSPNIRAIEPSEQSCFSLTFDTTTKLTLTAVDSQGGRDTETVTVRVK